VTKQAYRHPLAPEKPTPTLYISRLRRNIITQKTNRRNNLQYERHEQKTVSMETSNLGRLELNYNPNINASAMKQNRRANTKT